jgi:hypothetical protein
VNSKESRQRMEDAIDQAPGDDKATLKWLSPTDKTVVGTLQLLHAKATEIKVRPTVSAQVNGELGHLREERVCQGRRGRGGAVRAGGGLLLRQCAKPQEGHAEVHYDVPKSDE